MTDNLFPNLSHENCKETMPPVTTEQFKEADHSRKESQTRRNLKHRR